MDTNALAAMTGLPSGKKTHRGRRSRGKGPKVTSHAQHMAGIQAALDSGNQQGAKVHALNLVKALHRQQKATAQPMEPDADDPMGGY